MSWAECECGLIFTSDSGFDTHRIFTCAHRGRGHSPTDECWETRRCLTERELLDRGWRQDRRERWTPHPERPTGTFQTSAVDFSRAEAV